VFENTYEVNGIKYKKPMVYLLQENGLGVSEYAARTCYDSFENSENDIIKEIDFQISSEISDEHFQESYKKDLNSIEDSKLLDDLAWTYFHHSILEHAVLSFLIKGTSRGVLQEHARHRIQAISVRSTRYTMSGVINAFIVDKIINKTEKPSSWFFQEIDKLDMFVTDLEYSKLEIETIYSKLNFQFKKLGKEGFLKIGVAKSSLSFLNEEIKNPDEILKKINNGKKKRNVGDAFKHIVSDNWNVDMVVSFNLRSLKNYFTLRDSGAAFFQIKWLAEEMKKVTPKKYLDLIIKLK
jgi:thymidylate synthase (FAD)